MKVGFDRRGVAAGTMTGRARAPKQSVTIDIGSLDLTNIGQQLDKAGVIEAIRPQVQARVMAMMTELMADWKMRARAKAPVRKQRVKAGARGRKVELRPASQFSDFIPRKGSRTRERLADIGLFRRTSTLSRMSRTQSFLGAYRFTKAAGLFAGRSPAMIVQTKRGGLRGYFKGQLTGVAGGTLRDSIDVESIKPVPAEKPAIAAARGVLVATAPYAAPVHEGRKTGKHGKVGRRPFMMAAGKEVEANAKQGRYTGRG